MRVRLTENQYSSLLKEDTSLNKLFSLITTGDKDNIELAFQLGEGMESYVKGFSLDSFIQQNFGELIEIATWGGYNRGQLDFTKNQLVKMFNDYHLDLSNEDIKTMPKNIQTLNNITSIDLRGNLLEEFPHEILKMKNLEELILSINNIKNIPNNIDQLENLRFLNINGNNLRGIPESISNLSNLTSLGLSNNKISELPNSMSRMVNLKILNISYNPIGVQQFQNLNKKLPQVKIIFT